MNGDRLDVHDKGTLGQINVSASPVARSLGFWVGSGFGIGTSNPVTHLDQHRRLWEVLASKSERISVEKGSGQGAVDVPFDVFRGPVNRVLVVGIDRSGHWVVNGTVIGGRVSLSEEIALDGRVGRSEPLPINFIEIVRFENERADGTGSRAGLHGDGDLAKEDVLGALDGWRVGALGDGKLSTIRSRICQACAIFQHPVVALSLGEVGGDGLSESIVARAGYECVSSMSGRLERETLTFLGWVAVREGLSAGHTGSEDEACCREDRGTHVVMFKQL